MNKAYTKLIIILYIIVTITPRLVHSQCNQDLTVCSYCPGIANSTSATYKENLKALLSFSNLTLQTGMVGYYNKSKGKEPDDEVTVIGLCRGDLELNPELCNTCLKSIGAAVLESCPGQKDAIVWGEKCTLRYSNDSRFHLMKKEPLLTLRNNESVDVGAETFDARLNTLIEDLTWNTCFSVEKYASGCINVIQSQSIYSLVQCLPSLSPKECCDCLQDSVSKVPPGGVIGARLLKPSCTLRYEIRPFYAKTAQTFDEQFFMNVTVDPPKPSQSIPGNVDPSKPSQGTKKIIICVVSSVSAVVVLIISIGIFMKTRKNKSRREIIIGKEEIGSVEPSQFDFATIRMAVEDFSDRNRLGQGGFGPVYKGIYNGQDIAVKRLSKTSQQGDLEFKNEVKLVANLQHRNLVRLLGFCLDKMERLLIYEYIPNSSLDKFIFDSKKRAKMDWDMRYKIIEGIARGIIDLHVDSNLRIIHRDLKASNILLDEKMNPKISDFGMARLFGVDQTQDGTNRIMGTYGYMAPEYALYGHISIKSDVFSFGVLLLEIVCGQKNNSIQFQYDEEEGGGDLLPYAWRIWRDRNYSSLIDPIIFGCPRIEEIIRCVHIGLLCVQENLTQRPTMNSVLHMLNTHSEALPEPSKPALFIESSYFGSCSGSI